MAEYVARKVAQRTRDVRQVVQLAKLVESPEEVDRFETVARRQELNSS